METAQVESKINEFLIEEFELEPKQLVPDAELMGSLDLDSLDFVDLVVAIEESFGIKLKGEDFEGVTKLQDLYDLLHSRLN